MPFSMTSAEAGASRSEAQIAVLRGLLREAISTRFGSYLLFEELGRGGSGIVYRARRDGDDHDVALKQLTTGTRASDLERQAFLRGAHTAKELQKQPNIVPVLDIGEADGCAYFTMQLVEGSSLAEVIVTCIERAQRPAAGTVALWMKDIASAVAHAHHSGVLHRDLNPSNILIDEKNEPQIIDFGSAGRKLKPAGGSCSQAPGLSHYMAPEQAMGERGQDSADIYALGVILYELLTGCVPYEGHGCGELASELTNAEPVVPPRARDRYVNPHLELVCLKCLEKRPERRYRSADCLAEDLALIIEGFPPHDAQLERATTQLARWLLRQPALLAVLGGLLLVGTVAIIAARSFTRSTAELERSALETNGFIANSYAGALLSQLREFADRVEHAAASPAVRELAERKTVLSEAPGLEQFSRGFGSIYVASTEGQLLTQWPSPSHSVVGRNYDFRDYFRGGQLLGKAGIAGTYLGRVYLAESKHQMQFAFSAPVLTTGGAWQGLLIGALPVDSAIGKLNLRGPAESGRIVAVLGPRDNDRVAANQPLPSDLCFVVHPRLARGREVYLRGTSVGTAVSELATAPGGQFELRWVKPKLISDYRDPVTGGDEPWLAAFAPVGQTGYVVVVQTTRDAVLAGSRSLSRKLFVSAGIPLALGIALLALLARLPAQRRKKLSLGSAARARG